MRRASWRWRHLTAGLACLLAARALVAQDAGTGDRGEGVRRDARPSLAVAGFSRDVELDAWRDARVGLGLVGALADTLYGSGWFRLLEEKAEVREALHALASRRWAAGPGAEATAGTELDASIAALRPDVVASGRVLRFQAPASRASVGPFQRAQRTVTVDVEVTLTEVASGRSHRARGQGRVDRVAMSALFTVHDDRVLLDQTAVGRATMEALREAAGRALGAYRASRSP